MLFYTKVWFDRWCFLMKCFQICHSSDYDKKNLSTQFLKVEQISHLVVVFYFLGLSSPLFCANAINLHHSLFLNYASNASSLSKLECIFDVLLSGAKKKRNIFLSSGQIAELKRQEGEVALDI